MSKARVDTRRLYRFEHLFLHTHRCPGNKDTSIEELRKLASRVWRQYKKKRSRECPSIWAGKGVFYSGVYCSYYEVDPVHKIVLTRSQRKPTVLLHEMAHALGRGLHDAAFCALYFELLHKYLGYDLDELKLQAANFKVKAG